MHPLTVGESRMRAQPPLPVWSVGGGSRKSVEPWFLEHFSPADEPDKDGLYSRALGLRFQLDKRHFNNPLELKCSATVGGHTWDRVISPGLATLTNQKLAQESLRRGPDVGHLLPGNCVTPRCPEVLTLAAISTTSTDKQLQQNIIKRVHSNLLSSRENTANMVEHTATSLGFNNGTGDALIVYPGCAPSSLSPSLSNNGTGALSLFTLAALPLLCLPPCLTTGPARSHCLPWLRSLFSVSLFV
uniref:Uncharacterized protein n=1 Tax=Timema cristinae TaxID=61476 RepID=A0A7R9D9N7_TIMCR|nr:unnamed protein product [Timema cristinae]